MVTLMPKRGPHTERGLNMASPEPLQQIRDRRGR
jgi:hypothetical protein